MVGEGGPADEGGELAEPGAPEPSGSLECRSKVWLERDGRVALSEWRVSLLEAIDEMGSLARAAERMKVPYRTAWYKLREIRDCLGVTLVETQSGGAEGGGTQLTPEAREIVARFRRVTRGLAAMTDQRFRAEFGDLLK